MTACSFTVGGRGSGPVKFVVQSLHLAGVPELTSSVINKPSNLHHSRLLKLWDPGIQDPFLDALAS